MLLYRKNKIVKKAIRRIGGIVFVPPKRMNLASLAVEKWIKNTRIDQEIKRKVLQIMDYFKSADLNLTL